jgi:hypothetical protein
MLCMYVYVNIYPLPSFILCCVLSKKTSDENAVFSPTGWSSAGIFQPMSKTTPSQRPGASSTPAGSTPGGTPQSQPQNVDGLSPEHLVDWLLSPFNRDLRASAATASASASTSSFHPRADASASPHKYPSMVETRWEGATDAERGIGTSLVCYAYKCIYIIYIQTSTFVCVYACVFCSPSPDYTICYPPPSTHM